MQSEIDNNDSPLILNAHEVLGTDELLALSHRIIDSGILGRSKHYPALLQYLVQSSLSGKSPKEIELAIDVLKRDNDFDVSNDSSVRVYIYQLRKKLDSYYERFEN